MIDLNYQMAGSSEWTRYQVRSHLLFCYLMFSCSYEVDKVARLTLENEALAQSGSHSLSLSLETVFTFLVLSEPTFKPS